MSTLHTPLNRPQSGSLTPPKPVAPEGPSGTAFAVALAAIAVGVAALMVLAGFNLVSTGRELRDQLDARVQEASRASAAFVQTRLDTVAASLESFAARPDVIELAQAGRAGQAQLMAILSDDIKAPDPTLYSISVLDPSGRCIVTTAGGQYIGIDFSARDYYRGVIRTGETYVSKVYSAVQPGRAMLANIITPIAETPGGAPVGYLTAAQSVERTQAFLQSFATTAGLGLTVTDQNGATVASTEPSPIGKVDRDNESWLDPALRGEAGIATVDSLGGKAVVSYQPLPSGWVVAAQLPLSTVADPMSQLRQTTILLTAGLGIVVIVAGALLHRANRARERQLLAQHHERQRIARDVNDTIVQDLVAAETTYDIGRYDEARDLLRTASRQARDWVGQLLIEEGRPQPGTARRNAAAQQPSHQSSGEPR